MKALQTNVSHENHFQAKSVNQIFSTIPRHDFTDAGFSHPSSENYFHKIFMPLFCLAALNHTRRIEVTTE